MGWLVSSGVNQLPFCPSCSQATIILPNDKVAENPEMAATQESTPAQAPGHVAWLQGNA
jgi:hypothetical protein